MKKSTVLKISFVTLLLTSFSILGSIESKAWGKKCCEPEPVCCDPCAKKQVVKKVKTVQPEVSEEVVVKNEVVTEEIKQDEPVVEETKIQEVKVKVEEVKPKATNYFPGLY